MNMWLLFAGVWASLLALVHVFMGGPEIAKPLLQSRDVPSTAKYVNYYCWHLVSFNLAMMAGLLITAGLGVHTLVLGLVATLQAGFYFVWGIALPLLKQQTYRDMPQGWLFLPLVVLGAIGAAA